MNQMQIYPFERKSDLLEFFEFDQDRLKNKIFKIFKYLEYTGHVEVKDVEFSFKPRGLKYYRLYKTDTFTAKVTCQVTDRENVMEKIFSLHLPLMLNRKFMINGYENTPVFQLVDPSIVSRPGLIFVRSAFNDLSIVYDKLGEKCKAYIFKKKIPLSTILFAVNGFRKTCKQFGVVARKKKYDPAVDSKEHKMIFKDKKNSQCIEIKNMDQLDPLGKMIFMTACNETYRDVLEEFATDSYFVGMLGYYFFDKRNFKKKGQEILESLENSFFDPITRDQLNYDGNFANFLIKTITDYKSEQEFDFLDLSRRVLRLEDYLLTPLFKKVFSIVRVSMKYPQRVHHIKIKPDEIMNSLPKAELQPLVQYDSSTNPIAEVANFYKCSVFGIDGLQKDQVSLAMRNLHPSYYGAICPIDTPDGPNCGVVTNLTATAQLDLETGKVVLDKEMKTKDVVSISVATIPFLEKNDGVRLQMGANQSEQSLILENADIPMIQTGVEHMTAKMSTFTRRSPVDGSILFVNKDFIIVKSDLTQKNFLVDTRDEFTRKKVFKQFKTSVKVGDKVTKNQIVAYDKFSIKDEKTCIGKNMKTCFYCYEGYTYEDAIVISEAASEKLTHWSYNVADIHLEPHETLKKLSTGYLPTQGDVIVDGLVARKYSVKPETQVLFDFDKETRDITIPEGSEIMRVEVFINDVHVLDDDLAQVLDTIMKKQIAEEQAQLNVVKRFIDDPLTAEQYKTELVRSSKIGKFYTNKHFEGVLIKVYSRKKHKVHVGDKLANRAGNKGVISLILPESAMPRDENDQPFEVCLNPMGVITRMNVGQLFELTLTTACKKITEMMSIESSGAALQLMTEFIELIDNTEKQWYSKQVKDKIKGMTKAEKDALYNDVILKGLTVYQPPFCSITKDNYLQMLKRLDIQEKQHLFIPAYKKRTTEPVACGYMYMLKLLHTSESKIHSRATGPYSQLTGQPLQGKRNQGAQRLGEMEIWALAAHDASAVIKEILTIKSDDVKGRKIMIRNFLDATPITLPNSESSLSKNIFLAYLKGLMLDLKRFDTEED